MPHRLVVRGIRVFYFATGYVPYARHTYTQTHARAQSYRIILLHYLVIIIRAARVVRIEMKTKVNQYIVYNIQRERVSLTAQVIMTVRVHVWYYWRYVRPGMYTVHTCCMYKVYSCAYTDRCKTTLSCTRRPGSCRRFFVGVVRVYNTSVTVTVV